MSIECMEVGSISPPRTIAEGKKKRRKKKNNTLVAQTFSDLYTLTGETLGEGSYGKVRFFSHEKSYVTI